MTFVYYDLILLLIFIIGISTFLYKNKKNIKTEGQMVLYPTQWGIIQIEKFGEKHPKFMKAVSYTSIVLGYILMIAAVYFLYQVVSVYLLRADVVRAVKIPPIMPLIPYLPQMFSISWLPNFYFTYWIIILAIVAITHEFAHGIVAIYHKVKVKTTGFGFFPKIFPIFLAAFVELDEKAMAKKSKFKQLSVLSAGVFANILTTIIAIILMAIFFTFAFTAQGVNFDTYDYKIVNMSNTQIYSINGFALNNSDAIQNSLNNSNLIKVNTSSGNYLATQEMLLNPVTVGKDVFYIMYYYSPAAKANLSGTIIQINGKNITSFKQLSSTLKNKTVGENISITTINNSKQTVYNLTIEEYTKNTTGIGIGFLQASEGKIIQKITKLATSYKDSRVSYLPTFGASMFIYNLLWWLILISLSVAIMNMLPVGIFDGGRFFYLTVLGITGSEKVAKVSFKITTYIFLLSMIALMVFWVLSFF